MRPRIAVLAEVDDERTTSVLYPYIRAIERSGGLPVLVPFVEDENVLDEWVALCDGFFFTGGVDVSPIRYGEGVAETCGKVQLCRDALEFAMVQRALAAQKPILAVCRGAQLVNVALGGTLYQDIPTEMQTTLLHRQSEPKFSPSHAVRVIEHTPLMELVGKEWLEANSFHHQAIKHLGKGLAVMAVAEDGIIEAVYATGASYLRAYQWHPERLYDTYWQHRTLFDDFIKACR